MTLTAEGIRECIRMLQARHVTTCTANAEKELDALLGEVARLRGALEENSPVFKLCLAEERLRVVEQERDEYARNRNVWYDLAHKIAGEREDAEAVRDQLREALEPFLRGSGPDREGRAPTWETAGQHVVWLNKGEWERAAEVLARLGERAKEGES